MGYITWKLIMLLTTKFAVDLGTNLWWGKPYSDRDSYSAENQYFSADSCCNYLGTVSTLNRSAAFSWVGDFIIHKV